MTFFRLLKLCHFHTLLFSIPLTLFVSFHAIADVKDEIAEFDKRLYSEVPMPIGEVLENLEKRLFEDKYNSSEKAAFAASYAIYNLEVYQAAPPDVLEVLEALQADPEYGGEIRLGLARMYGIDGQFQRSYQLFDGLLNEPKVSPKLKAMTIAYLIITYSEGEVFNHNAKLIGELNQLVTDHELEDIKPLYYYVVADFYHSIYSPNLALEYYQNTLHLAQTRNDWVLVSDTLYAMGILCRNEGDYSRAIDYFQQTLENDKKLDMDYAEFLALYGLTTTYFRSGAHDKANALAEQVLSHSLTSPFYDSEIYRLKAVGHLENEQLDEAQTALNKAREIYDVSRSEEETTWRAELDKVSALIAARHGDYQSAFEQYQTFHQNYLDARKTEDQDLLESAGLVHQIEQQKQKTAQLEQQNQMYSELLAAKDIAEKTQQQYNRWLVISIVLALITLTIIIVLFVKSRQTSALNAIAREKAEMHNRLKTEFISNISHEIRTPLNAIIGFGQVLTEKLEKSQNKKLTTQIVNSSEMLLQLINDLLDFSKIEAGKLELDPGDHNIRQSLRKLADIFHAQASNKGLKLKFNIDANTPKLLRFDELRFKQVLANLISNAIKFSEQGFIEIGIKVVTQDEYQCQLQVWVKDTGIGIHKDKQENLFQPFIQAESSTARKYGGTGLGLNIGNNLLKLMNTQLQVESEKGTGSRFFFLVDFDKVVLQETSAQSTNQKQPEGQRKQESPFTKNRILLVEDNEINAEVIKAILADTNLVITHAINGKKAIEEVEQQEFDLILMDIQMPEMDGYQATAILRGQMQITIPILALTANAMQQDVDACISAGMNEHLSKPVHKARLFEVLAKYLN